MSEVNRRQFVLATASACAGLCVLNSFCEAEATSRPTSISSGPVKAGNVKDYPKNAISRKFATQGFFIAHEDDQIYAMTVRCTHRDAKLVVTPDNQLRCPAHGSVFSEQGTAQSGPAKRSLVRFKITGDDQGNLTVDPSTSFPEKDWDKPDAFVKA